LQVKINFYGQFRYLVDSKRITLNVEPPITLLGLIELLCERYGPPMRRMLLNEDTRKSYLKPEVRIMARKKSWDFTSSMADLEEEIGEEEGEVEIFFIPPLQGGNR